MYLANFFLFSNMWLCTWCMERVLKGCVMLVMGAGGVLMSVLLCKVSIAIILLIVALFVVFNWPLVLRSGKLKSKKMAERESVKIIKCCVCW